MTKDSSDPDNGDAPHASSAAGSATPEDAGPSAAGGGLIRSIRSRLTAKFGKQEPGSESLTRLIAPIFAAFSLPTIFSFVQARDLSPARHAAVLSLLLAATGLFMASIQLSIGRLNDAFGNYVSFRLFRAYLTIFGIVAIALALALLVESIVHGWWIWFPLGVLLLGGLGPGLAMIRVQDPPVVATAKRACCCPCCSSPPGGEYAPEMSG